MAASDKTEEATPHRKAQARRDGQIARSPEISVVVGLGVGLLVLRVFAASAVGALGTETTRTFANLSSDPSALGTVGRDLASASAFVLAPFLAAAVASALVAGFGQTRFSFSLRAARPKLSMIDPRKGIKKFLPTKAGWELARTATKIGALLVVAWTPLVRLRDQLVRPDGLGIDTVLAILADQVWALLLRALLLALVIAAADYGYQRWSHRRDMRMSRTEVRQEHKDTEGSPEMKGERRRRQQALSRNRMLADVAQADVVLVNPTDYAIALRYEPGDPAPRVLARGAGHVAARIRAEASRHGVPVHVDVALCRTLYRQVEVGGFVPQALFDAIAVVLVWAYRRTGRRPAAAGARP